MPTTGHLRRWGVPAAAALVLAAVSALVFYLHAIQPEWGSFQGDLDAHLVLTEQILAGDRVVPHPGFHYMVGLLRSMGLSLSISATIVLVASQVATYGLTVGILRRFTALAPWQAGGIGLLLSLAAALYLPWFTTAMYRGHGTPNIWHSPTWVMMQPFAVGSLWALLEWHRSRARQAVAAASGCLLLSAVVKPSWAVVLLPVLGIAWLWELRRPTWWHLPVVAAPTVALLGFQFAVMDDGEGGGIALDPFTVWASKTPSLPLSVLVAVAFPLVAIAMARQSWRWWGFALGVGVWLTGFLQRAFLIEPARPGHGNWAWGYFIGLKVLFILAAVVAIRSGRWRLPMAVLLLHAVAGTMYIVRLVTGVGYH